MKEIANQMKLEIDNERAEREISNKIDDNIYNKVHNRILHEIAVSTLQQMYIAIYNEVNSRSNI